MMVLLNTIANILSHVSVKVAYNALGVPKQTGMVSAARHHHDRPPSKLMLNFGRWAGLQSTLAHMPFPHRRKWCISLAYGQLA